MASLNKVLLIGNLGKDPEVRHSQSGGKIVTFNMATSENWKDRTTGERREKTEWHRVVIFNEHLADIAEQYLKKGVKVYIEGALQTRKWTGNDGAEKYTTEIVLANFRGAIIMLGGRSEGDRGDPGPASSDEDSGGSASSEQKSSGTTGEGSSGGDLDDEIPF